MFWRFCVVSCLFGCGELLSIAAMQHLDIGTFSLLGQSFGIISTAVWTWVLFRRHYTILQYALILATAVSAGAFSHVQGAQHTSAPKEANSPLRGFILRIAGVGLTSLGAATQQWLFESAPEIPFMVQQCWMGFGATASSLFICMVVNGNPFSTLLHVFEDWHSVVPLLAFVVSGFSQGLLVKRLGAIAKAMCTPIILGICYMFAVSTGSALLNVTTAMMWAVNITCVLTFAVSKAHSVTKA
jgi:hypothetical protein